MNIDPDEEEAPLTDAEEQQLTEHEEAAGVFDPAPDPNYDDDGYFIGPDKDDED
jgi:hypothetical protein